MKSANNISEGGKEERGDCFWCISCSVNWKTDFFFGKLNSNFMFIRLIFIRVSSETKKFWSLRNLDTILINYPKFCKTSPNLKTLHNPYDPVDHEGDLEDNHEDDLQDNHKDDLDDDLQDDHKDEL